MAGAQPRGHTLQVQLLHNFVSSKKSTVPVLVFIKNCANYVSNPVISPIQLVAIFTHTGNTRLHDRERDPAMLDVFRESLFSSKQKSLYVCLFSIFSPKRAPALRGISLWRGCIHQSIIN